MNVCLVSQHYPPETAQGGIGTQTWNKARALARLGHVVHVLTCGARPGPDLRSEAEGGITVHRMLWPGREAGTEFAVYNAPTYWVGYTWGVFRQLRRLTAAIRSAGESGGGRLADHPAGIGDGRASRGRRRNGSGFSLSRRAR